MYIVARPSSPMLEPFVELLWYIEAPPPYGRERVLPSGAMQLIVNLGEDELRSYHDADHAAARRLRGAGLQGPFATPTVIDTRQQRAMLGVGFRPGGAHPFFAVPASAWLGISPRGKRRSGEPRRRRGWPADGPRRLARSRRCAGSRSAGPG